MKYIVFIISSILYLAEADTVGVDLNAWADAKVESDVVPINELEEPVTQTDEVNPADTIVDDTITPQEYTPPVQSQSNIDPDLVQEIIQETKRQKAKMHHLSTATPPEACPKIIESAPVKSQNSQLSMQSIWNRMSAFVQPIWRFAQDFPLQLLLLLSLFALVLYALIFAPMMKRVRKESENDEIDLSRHVVRKIESKPEGKILSSSQYSTLKGQLNEGYLYKKEAILLAKDLSQEDKDRELVMLDWKFNQILNFALPKLESDEGREFREGIEELMQEKESRETVRAFFRDLIQQKGIDPDLKRFIESAVG